MKAVLTGILALLILASGAPDRLAGHGAVQKIIRAGVAVYEGTFQEYAARELDESVKAEGSVYQVHNTLSLAVVRDLQKAGLMAFRLEDNSDAENIPDRVAILPAVTNQLEILRLLKTGGSSEEASSEAILAMFTIWSGKFQYRIVGAGNDFVQAEIIKAPADWRMLARDILSLNPDSVEDGRDKLKTLEKELKTTKMISLWWE